MYMHFVHNNIEIRTNIEYIYCTTDEMEGIGSTSIDVNETLTIFVHTNAIDYLCLFDDDGKRALLIKNGEVKYR